MNMQTGRTAARVARLLRPNQTDTFSITSLTGQTDTDDIRTAIQAIDEHVLRSVFTTAGYESHDVASMVQLAVRDGVPLTGTKVDAGWLREASSPMSAELKRRLVDPAATDGIARWSAECDSLRGQLRNSLQSHRSEVLRTAKRQQELDGLIAEANTRIRWLALEFQRVTTETRELEDLIWKPEMQAATRKVTRLVEEHAPDEVSQIDEELRRAQQVLRDLARLRMTTTVASAEYAATSVSDTGAMLSRQRASLNCMERYVIRLTQELEQLTTSVDARSREEQQRRMAASVNALRHQVYAMCQELARQEVTWKDSEVLTERESIDRYEVELRRQIARLQERRDALLHAADVSDQVRFCSRTGLEAQQCECQEHVGYLVWPSREVTVEEAAPAVPVDRSREREQLRLLSARRAELWRRLMEARDELHGLWKERPRLEREWARLTRDTQADELRTRLAAAEDALSHAREQWQSIALAHGVCDRLYSRWSHHEESQVIVDASRFMNRLTEGKYPAMRYLGSDDGLALIDTNGEELPLSCTSRGTLDQASLSFRLALAAEYARRGQRFPLLLDDVLADTDALRSHAAVELLKEIGTGGQQVIYFTCQEHLADVFETFEVSVISLPNSHRGPHPGRRETTTTDRDIQPTTPVIRTPPASVAVVQAEVTPPVIETADDTDSRSIVETRAIVPLIGAPIVVPAGLTPEPVKQAQRSEPARTGDVYWLQPESPISLVPSLGEQMARRLATMDVASVCDLIDFDPETADIPLQTLQIFAARLRIWQAEARLLCCVPYLTGRDAQLLASCGIMNSVELAEADADALTSRITRWLGSRPEGWGDRSTWPSRRVVSRWIEYGRRARTFHDARGFRRLDRDRDERERLERERLERERQERERMERERQERDRRDRKRTYAERSHDRDDSDNDRQRRRRRSRRGSEVSGRARAAREELRRKRRARRARQVALESDPKQRSINTLSSSDGELKYYLTYTAPVVDAPSIGPTTARRLERIGIVTVQDLLAMSAETVAERLEQKRIKTKTVTAWQHQARLMCDVPQLRGHDAQVLVACGIETASELAKSTPAKLFKTVGPFAESKEGQRMLRSAKTPDLDEVNDWVNWARQGRESRAA